MTICRKKYKGMLHDIFLHKIIQHLYRFFIQGGAMPIALWFHISAFLSTLFFTFILAVMVTFAADNSSVTMNDVLRHVAQSNPIILSQIEQVKATEEQYPQAMAGWKPSVFAEASLFSTNIDNSNFNNGDGATTKDYTLSIDQPLYRGGRTTAEVERARKLISTAYERLRGVEAIIFLDTMTAYRDVLRDRDIVSLQKNSRQNLVKELESALGLEKEGMVTKTDVAQARARATRAEADYIAATADLSRSEARFYQLVGFMPPKTMVIPYYDFDIPQDLESLQVVAEQKSPDMLIAYYTKEAAEYGVDVSRADLYPQVTAFASHNQQYDPQPGIIDDSAVQTIGVRARLALYQGGATRSRIREARRNAKRSDVQIEDVKRQVKQKVTSLWQSYRAAKAETESRKIEVEASGFSLDGIQEEMRNGQRSIFDVLESEEDYVRSKKALVSAQYKEAVAQYGLLEATGLLTLPMVLSSVQ